ncbi:hypothetical protein HAZT_HAZT005327 [Hyalella azteca]|uniref:CREG-like beta-barrel domain-containing protein n=1 Tax=Hyalella azteca TaxID=294128 RepID=A0A6A0H280_HYAAZ|nr:hypothetical protein HAZT_HAZT005327 [Hyalella azteca]
MSLMAYQGQHLAGSATQAAAWQWFASHQADLVEYLLIMEPWLTIIHHHLPIQRYIIHISDWATLATISTHANITGYPFANVFSISDGITSNSTGNPYFYLTDLELSVHDLKADPRASLTASLAQSSYCRQRRLDPQDPIKNGTAEAAAAQQALFSRHPEMQDWPQDHGWFVARLAIRHIYLLDYFGGAKVIDPQDYYAAQPF